MKNFKKILTHLMCLTLITLLVIPAGVSAAPSNHPVTLTTKDGAVPVYQPEKEQKLSLTLKNNTGKTLTGLTIVPEMDTSTSNWPFKIEKQDYKKTIDSLEAGETADITYSFTEREDVSTASYYIRFDIDFEENDTPLVCGVYIRTTAKPNTEEKDNNGTSETPGDSSGEMGGAVDNGIVSGGTESNSVPRVIVTGFSTEPAEVKAGSNFKLIVHLKNTSKKTAVQNMLFDFNAAAEGDEQTSAPVFLPASGSSSVYLDGIKANGTKDISIELNAKSDLTQKPYSIDMSMKYEDKVGNQFDGSSSLSIPVKQDARFELSEFELSSSEVEVGNEVNIMCNLYNLGRTKLYNVKVHFEGEGISKGEVFVGNVESGGTAAIDSMVTGEKATTGNGLVKMILTYEDEAMNPYSYEKELTLMVTEPVFDDMPIDNDMIVEEEPSFPILPVILIGILIFAVVVVFVIKRKKKKHARIEEDGLVDELDRLIENERQ